VAVTLEQVVALAELDLRPATVVPSLDRPLRWVAVSEQTDPSPWIEPGDLVLTTGMALTGAVDECAAYVDRLVQADAAGVGFGVGLHHARIPAALVDAAERAGLPVVEVSEPVPFVAVSRAVSRLMAAEEYAESGTSFESQRRMIRACLATGGEDAVAASTHGTAEAVLPVLARHVGGFALSVSTSGQVRSAAPADASVRAAEFTGEIDRLRPRGLLASASIAAPHEHVVILPVGVRDTVSGFLVVGSPHHLTAGDQAVLNLAVSLMSWESITVIAGDRHRDAWRRLLVDLARLEGLSVERLSELGVNGVDPTCAVAFVVRPDSAEALTPPPLDAAVVCSDGAGGLLGFAGVGPDGQPAASLSAGLRRDGVRTVGLSAPTDLTSPANVRQAIDQARQAASSGRGWVQHADLAHRSFDALVDADVAAHWSRACLAPILAAPDSADMCQTLRAWLAEHGQVDATAQQLGIHRHTVRHRLRRIETVLGRSLDDPSVRANLWFALGSVSSSGDVLARE
jgi:purine catabolism regulator